MKHCIEATSLHFAYTESAPVLRDVTMAVHSGLVTGIIGPNGAGKSTLLKLLCGLLSPDRGTVFVDNRPLDAYSPRARARIVGYMPQSVTPAFGMPVADVVALGRFPHLGPFGGLGPNDWAVVRACLDQTECRELADRDFLSLSGGERQRVMLASVLAQESRLLLLDEPTSSLDLPHEVAFFRQLRRLASDGLGVIVVTHDINMAGQFCDRLVLLGHDHGLACQGAPEAVLSETALSTAYGSPLAVRAHPAGDGIFVSVPGP